MTTDRMALDAPLWRDARARALLMAATLTVMANATISPALPGLERLFADDPRAGLLVRLLVPAPSLTVAVSAPFFGILVDRSGRRPVLILGVVLFAITGSAGLILPDLRTILISRLFLGLAVAMVMTAQVALVGDLFGAGQRQALMALQVTARNVGGLLFILLAGWAATRSPRLPFAIYGIAVLYLPSLLLSLRSAFPPVSGVRQGCPTGGGAAGWVWLLMALSVGQALTNMTFFLVPTQLPFLLAAAGRGSAVTGAALGMLMLSGGVAALFYGAVVRRGGLAGAYALGYALLAAGFLLVGTAERIEVTGLGVSAIGAGYALVTPGFAALMLALSPGARRGLAGGVLTTSIFLGQFASPFVGSPLASEVGMDGVFRLAALLPAALSLVAAGVALRGTRRRAAP